MGQITATIVTDSTIAGWRAWYADGTVVDSKSAIALPASGAQVVMVYFTDQYAPGLPYRQVYSGYDVYSVNGFSTVKGVLAAPTIDATYNDPKVYIDSLNAAMKAETF